MNTETLRSKVAELYPNQVWAKRVSKMDRSQLYAIWMSSQKPTPIRPEKATTETSEQIKETPVQNEKLF